MFAGSEALLPSWQEALKQAWGKGERIPLPVNTFFPRRDFLGPPALTPRSRRPSGGGGRAGPDIKNKKLAPPSHHHKERVECINGPKSTQHLSFTF